MNMVQPFFLSFKLEVIWSELESHRLELVYRSPEPEVHSSLPAFHKSDLETLRSDLVAHCLESELQSSSPEFLRSGGRFDLGSARFAARPPWIGPPYTQVAVPAFKFSSSSDKSGKRKTQDYPGEYSVYLGSLNVCVDSFI
jgi:hypothetical protein